MAFYRFTTQGYNPDRQDSRRKHTHLIMQGRSKDNGETRMKKLSQPQKYLQVENNNKHFESHRFSLTILFKYLLKCDLLNLFISPTFALLYIFLNIFRLFLMIHFYNFFNHFCSFFCCPLSCGRSHFNGFFSLNM